MTLCLPHARGGVSDNMPTKRVGILSSPRPWGCFQDYCSTLGVQKVFPTPVGVFLMRARAAADDESLPHARGGVSISASREI